MSIPHEQRTISELIAAGSEVQVGGFTLQRWADDTYFVESPSGEGTQVRVVALINALEQLFREHF